VAPLLALVAATVLAVILTRLHVGLGPRLKHFAPSDVRHRGQACLSGGVGIWVALLVVWLAVGKRTPESSLVLASSAAMVLIGLWDDVRPLRPQRKLLLQVLVATVSVALGLRFETTMPAAIHIPLSVLWLVAMANAFNLIDNMDGLAAGVAAIAAVFLAFHSLQDGALELALVAAAFAGAHAGFLPFNFRPARIFMGDCGSMGAGFFLGALAIVGTWRSASNLLLVVATPVLLFAVPIFNLLFVLVTRKLSGVPVFHGRADHINFRLLAHGLSEREAVFTVYALSAACGLLAVWYTQLSSLALMALMSVTTVGFLYLAVFLYEASVRRFYSDFGVEQRDGVDVARLPFVRHWWPFLQVLADLVLVSVGYYLAYVIRFEGAIPAVQERNFMVLLPIVILLKIAAFTQFGLYGSHWRYVGVTDLLRTIQAVALCALILAAAAILPWPGSLSRSVLVIDAILTVLLIAGSRVLLRLLREIILQTRSSEARVRTVIVGADDSGDIVLRMARQNGNLALEVVGFVDDDPRKTKAKIHGLPVLGLTSALPSICLQRRVQLAIVAMPSASTTPIGEIVSLCRHAGIRCKVLSLSLDDPPVTIGDAA
jgi:UDP-GlcNAc:undecaprenyl-phosphate GlcNAc-1-phosphate transferase